ncbi:hypothetical protein [Variovorax sp. PvP013]|uniref:hypothetical protein n=1 Tax=Variovorax sp. PvP013 TaxID=3156435 RepID=UPI003D1ABC8E
MRYDPELQKAGKFLVSSIQGDDGAHCRELVKMVKKTNNAAISLRIEGRNGKLVAVVGSAYKISGAWNFSDDYELELE